MEGDDIFDRRILLCGIISDMIYIAEQYNPTEITSIKDNIKKEKAFYSENKSNFIKDNAIFRTDVISTFLKRYKDKISPHALKIYNSVFGSIKFLNKNEFDSISNKNKISLYIFSYYILAHFYSLLTEDFEPLKNFREKIIKNISKILERENLIKPVQNIINNSFSDIFKNNKKNKDIADIVLNTVKNYDFENKYYEYINRQNKKKIKKKEKKKEKEREKENDAGKDEVKDNEKLKNQQCPNNENYVINEDKNIDKESINKIIEIKDNPNSQNQKNNSITETLKSKEQSKNREKSDISSFKDLSEFNEEKSKNEYIDNGFILKVKKTKKVKKEYSDIELKEGKIMKFQQDYEEKEKAEIQKLNLSSNSSENNDIAAKKYKEEQEKNDIKKDEGKKSKKEEIMDMNKIIEKIDILKEQVSNLNNDRIKKDNLINSLVLKITDLNGKIIDLENDKNGLNGKITDLNGKITDLENQCKELMDNQIVFWGYLNLITNGRDIEKSIVHYLYIYLKFKPKEEEPNYLHLSKIIEALNKDNYDKDKITIEKDKLVKFLYLDFFLSRLFNKIVHRGIKFNSKEANNKLKLIPKYTFKEKFDNLIFFINRTIKENEIQEAIKQTINDYKSDERIMNYVKYDEQNLFVKNNSSFETILKEKDIIEIQEFLAKIKIENNSFVKLCEEKSWKSDKKIEEIIPKPVFFKDGVNLTEIKL